MSTQSFALFATRIGPCGIAWGAAGITGVHLPGKREAETRARLVEKFPLATESALTGVAASAAEGIVALLDGEARDLCAIPLDMARVPDFHRRVYELSRQIRPGQTRTYGEIARELGGPDLARAVGQALGRNPFALVVPCHRVVATDGRMGGFSAAGGVTTKLRLLTIEGAHAAGSLLLGDDDAGFRFDVVQALAHLRAKDPALGRLIDSVGSFGMKPRRTTSIFAALAEAIVYQQLHGRAAATIYARLCALFPHGHRGPTAAHILRASEEKLRGAGLSGSKALALRDLARRSIAGEIPTLEEADCMPDEDLIERLSAVRGIGRWTVEMLMMIRLGRPDILPLDDYGVRKGFGYTFCKNALPSRDEMTRRGLRWSPYRSVASWYLWRAADRAEQEAMAKTAVARAATASSRKP